MDGIERAMSILATEVSVPDEVAEFVWDAYHSLEIALDMLRQQATPDESATSSPNAQDNRIDE